MGIKKISQLDSLDAITGDAEIAVVQGGVTKRHKPGLSLNARAFGASPSASAATNTTAFQAAATALIAAGGGQLVIPAGNYVHNGFTIANPAALHLCGTGPATALICTTGNGITITSSTGNDFIQISDLRLLTQASGVGKAIYVNYASAIGISQHLIIENVTIHGNADGSPGFWNEGVHVNNVRNVVMSKVSFEGNIVGATKSTNGFRASADAGQAVNVAYVQCTVTFADVGWLFEGVDCEGTLLSQCFSLNTRVGVKSTHSALEDWLGLSHCHFNTWQKGVELTRVESVFIDHCVFFAADDYGLAAAAAVDWIGVEVNTAASKYFLHDNVFRQLNHPGSQTQTGIRINAGADMGLHRNLFELLDVGIYVAAGVGNVSLFDNHYLNTTTRFTDAGAQNFQVLEIGIGGFWEASGSSTAYHGLRAPSAAVHRMTASAGAADSKVTELLRDTSGLTIRHLNDNFTLKNTPIVINNDGSVVFATSLAIGTDPAEAGSLRLPNGAANGVVFEASPAGTDIVGLSVDVNERVNVGGSGAASVALQDNNGIVLAGAYVSATGGCTIDTGFGLSTGQFIFELAAGRTGDGITTLDLHASNADDYGLRITRNGGVNGTGQIIHRGTGSLRIETTEAGAITIRTSDTSRWHFEAVDGDLVPQTDISVDVGATATRVDEMFSRTFRPGAASAQPIWTSGSGTPEGAVTAPVGSLFTRTDGGAATTLYVKESGAGNTGWVAK